MIESKTIKKNKIAIIGALDEEIKKILFYLTKIKKIKWSEFCFYEGELFGQEVVVIKSGVGKTSAAMICQKTIDQYNLTNVIFTGVAGSLNNKLNIGDVVISNDCVHHDLETIELGFLRGVIPYTKYRFFKADVNLKKIALSTKLKKNKVVEGRILTGDQFLTQSKIKEYIYLKNELAGDVVEMEGAAVAQVCVFNKIPFVVIRSVTDKADGKAAENFNKFLNLAAENSFQIVKNILQKI